jgi:hypothetical protein
MRPASFPSKAARIPVADKNSHGRAVRVNSKDREGFIVSWQRTTAGQIAAINAETTYTPHTLKRVEINCLL